MAKRFTGPRYSPQRAELERRLDAAYQQGADFYDTHGSSMEPETCNPYPPHTRARNCWSKGWQDRMEEIYRVA